MNNEQRKYNRELRAFESVRHRVGNESYKFFWRNKQREGFNRYLVSFRGFYGNAC